MEHAFDGPRLRIARATAHIDGLRAEVREWREAGRGARFVLGEPDGDDGTTSLIVASDPGSARLPDHWALLVSEIVHHLRAALDGAVWQLGLANGSSEADLLRLHPPVGFPIDVDLGKRDDRVRKKLGYLTPPCINVIVAAQPSGSSRAERERHPLVTLQRISNTDKHRMLSVVVERAAGVHYSTAAFQLDLLDEVLYPDGPLVDGAHVGEIPTSTINLTADPKDHEIDIIPRLELSTGRVNARRTVGEAPAIEQRDLLVMLLRMHEAVESIVTDLACEYDRMIGTQP